MDRKKFLLWVVALFFGLQLTGCVWVGWGDWDHDEGHGYYHGYHRGYYGHEHHDRY